MKHHVSWSVLVIAIIAVAVSTAAMAQPATKAEKQVTQVGQYAKAMISVSGVIKWPTGGGQPVPATPPISAAVECGKVLVAVMGPAGTSDTKKKGTATPVNAADWSKGCKYSLSGFGFGTYVVAASYSGKWSTAGLHDGVHSAPGIGFTVNEDNPRVTINLSLKVQAVPW